MADYNNYDSAYEWTRIATQVLTWPFVSWYVCLRNYPVLTTVLTVFAIFFLVGEHRHYMATHNFTAEERQEMWWTKELDRRVRQEQTLNKYQECDRAGHCGGWIYVGEDPSAGH